MKKIRVPWIAVFLMASLFSCGEKREANKRTESDVQGKILATVNGVPITEVEYRRKVYEAEAQLRAFQRQELSAFYREYIKNKAVVTDPEAKEYFEKNSKRIQTKVHVWQIYYKGEEARIAEDHKDLISGKPFEKVASRRFPNLPKGMKAPWDLGYLYWSQIPASWQGVIDRLEPGQASDIIKGPNERFRVIRLVDKTIDPKITFATEKGKIVEVVQKQKTDELHDTMLSQMRTKSKIIFLK